MSDTPFVDQVGRLGPAAEIWKLARQLERDLARLIDALRLIASCEPKVNGDVINIAQALLEELK